MRDKLITSNIQDPVLEAFIRNIAKKCFGRVQSPDGFVVYIDTYKRSNGQLYNRASFYVGVPPSGRLLMNAWNIALRMERTSGHKFTAYVARRRSRPTDSIKIFGEFPLTFTP